MVAAETLLSPRRHAAELSRYLSSTRTFSRQRSFLRQPPPCLVRIPRLPPPCLVSIPRLPPPSPREWYDGGEKNAGRYGSWAIASALTQDRRPSRVVVVDEHGTLVHSLYRRHRSDIKTTLAEALHDLALAPRRSGRDRRRHGVGGHRRGGASGPAVRAGGDRHHPRRAVRLPRGGRHHRAGRRRREGGLPDGWAGAAHERHLRRRHRRIHRHHGLHAGHLFQEHELAGPGSQPHLPHRLALRRVRPNRRAAAAQRRGAHVRPGRQRAGSRSCGRRWEDWPADVPSRERSCSWAGRWNTFPTWCNGSAPPWASPTRKASSPPMRTCSRRWEPPWWQPRKPRRSKRREVRKESRKPGSRARRWTRKEGRKPGRQRSARHAGCEVRKERRKQGRQRLKRRKPGRRAIRTIPPGRSCIPSQSWKSACGRRRIPKTTS